MVELTRFTVEQIRVSYASGLYHKADLAVRYSCHFKNPLEIMKVLNYEVFENVREDLKLQIVGINYIDAIKEEYREAIVEAAIVESEKVVKDSNKAAATIQETIKRAEEVLKAKLKLVNKEFNTNFTEHDIKSRLP